MVQDAFFTETKMKLMISSVMAIGLLAAFPVAAATDAPTSLAASDHDQQRHNNNVGKKDHKAQPSVRDVRPAQRHQPQIKFDKRRDGGAAGVDIRMKDRDQVRVRAHRPDVIVRRHFNRNISATRRFHWRAYHRPHGWYYRRWTFGEFLPRLFWAQTYWITSYWMFELPAPPPGCVWVRYGDDALLVDSDTGEIVEVVYDLFE
jgi:Ni/Co efflux regulator RcnB